MLAKVLRREWAALLEGASWALEWAALGVHCDGTARTRRQSYFSLQPLERHAQRCTNSKGEYRQQKCNTTTTTTNNNNNHHDNN